MCSKPSLRYLAIRRNPAKGIEEIEERCVMADQKQIPSAQPGWRPLQPSTFPAPLMVTRRAATRRRLLQTGATAAAASSLAGVLAAACGGPAGSSGTVQA